MNKYISFLLLLLFLTTTQAQFGLEQKVISVEILPSQDRVVAGEEFQLAVVIHVEPDLHINSNTPKEEFQIPTLVTFQSTINTSFGKPLFPKADLKAFSFSEEKIPVYDGTVYVFTTVSTSPALATDQPLLIKGTVSYQGCNDSVCFPPGEESFSIELPVVAKGTVVNSLHKDVFDIKSQYESAPDELGGNLTTDEKKAQEMLDKGLVYALFAFLLVGLALNLTPCVYPVIPLTVSYFGGRSNKTRGSAFVSALAYLIGIAITFALLGLVSGFAGQQWGFLFQSPWFVIAIVTIILALAASMFGAFEITVPSFLMSKFGGARQGVIGAFFMGLTVGVLIAPCAAGIIIGLVGLIAKMGLVVKGTVLFFVMGIGLGLPYLVLATFSGLLNKLPQSGMWMVWMRKFFGILLVGVAIYFIVPQLAQVYDQLGFLLGILTIFGGLLLGILDHSPGYTTKFKVVRALFGVALIILGFSWTNSAIHSKESEIAWVKYDGQTVQELLQDSKPIFIDFYADWCAPCKQLDRETFRDQTVMEKSKSFTMVKVDCTAPDSQTKAFMDQFYVTGMPTLIFISSSGRELENLREIGFVGPSRFIKSMEAALQEE